MPCTEEAPCLNPLLRWVHCSRCQSDKSALFSFSRALYLLKTGNRVSRSGWNGKGMWLIHIQSIEWSTETVIGNHDVSELARLPFIAMKTADGQLVPWLASQTDLLSDDWGIVRESK